MFTISCINQTKSGSKTTFLATQQNKNIRENISCVFGSKQLSNLLEITETHLDDDIVEEYGIKNACAERFQLRGFISNCEHGSGRSTTDRQFYYINSRPCEPTKVIKLTNEIYHRYNLHQYPFVLLNIIVPKDSVDVNVTPDKRLIFLEDEKLLLASVKSTLIRLFENIPSAYKLNTPVSVLPSRNSSSSHTDGKLTDANKCLSIESSKWRHFSYRTDQQTLPTSTSSKRSLSQSCQNSSNSKQMKLDEIFKIPKTEVEKKDTHSGCSDVDEQSLENEENENIDVKNIEDIIESECTNSSSESISNHAIENGDVNTLDVEREEDGIQDECCENENDVIMIDEPVENGIGNDAILEASEEFEEDIFIQRSVDLRQVIKSDLSPVKPVARSHKATIDTSIEALRSMVRDRRQRRKDNLITNRFHAEIDPTKNQVAEDELKKEISKSMFCEMKIVGQFNLGFIIVKLENDLFIVDQHATDEKYNFETLQRTTTLKSQKLIAPQDLNLTAINECVLVSNIDILQKNGFEFLVDPSAEITKRVKLISIPVSQNWQFGKEDIDEMLFMLQDAPNTLCRPSRIRAMFASRACRKSIMIGMPLSVADMRRLINNMGTIEQPWNCPHGRPTMRHLVNLSLLN